MDQQHWEPTVLRKNPQQQKDSSKSPPKRSSAPQPVVALDHDEKPIEYFTIPMGKKIQSLRNEKGWTQEELAKKLNIQKKTINDIEQGKEKYSGPMVSKLKKVLGNFSW